MSSLLIKRLTQLQAHLKPDQAFLLTDPADITYFSAFSFLVPEEREGFLLVTRTQAFLLHSSFSPVPANTELVLLKGTSPRHLHNHLKQIKSDHHLTELLIDKTKLYADEYEAILKLESISFLDLDRDNVWEIRCLKDETEIAAIRQAGQIAKAAFAALQPNIKPGMSEKEISHALELEMYALGSERPAFPTIVAFNDHAALPHHQPTETVLTPETGILIDFGATYQGYRSDMTRSFWFGTQPNPVFEKIKTITHQAFEAVMLVLATPPQTQHPPLTAADLDATARTLITEAGFGPQFIHTTGHGVGLDIHEQPSLNWSNHVLIQPGMVITIEPGIYLPQQYGYRHEDTVVITQTGYQSLIR